MGANMGPIWGRQDFAISVCFDIRGGWGGGGWGGVGGGGWGGVGGWGGGGVGGGWGAFQNDDYTSRWFT